VLLSWNAEEGAVSYQIDAATSPHSPRVWAVAGTWVGADSATVLAVLGPC